MTQRTSTQLKNEFMEMDPHDWVTNLFDSIPVLDEAIQHDQAITVGASGAGYDIKFFGNIDSGYVMWDASDGAFDVVGSATHLFEAPADLDGSFDVGGTFSNVTNATAISGFYKVKVNGTLFKVPFYADT